MVHGGACRGRATYMPQKVCLDFYLSTQSHFILVVWSRKEKFLKDEAFENKEIENVE